MTDMYEAGELLEEIQQIVEVSDGSEGEKMPNGEDPVYWPKTIHGKTGMIQKNVADLNNQEHKLPYSGGGRSRDKSAQTS